MHNYFLVVTWIWMLLGSKLFNLCLGYAKGVGLTMVERVFNIKLISFLNIVNNKKQDFEKKVG